MIDDVSLPFAGRQAALARLHQYCSDAAQPQAFVLLGWRGTGKSALLAHCETAFDAQFVCVIVPLEQMPLRGEPAFLRALATLIAAALERRGFSTASLPTEPEDDAELRAWLRDDFLTRALSIVRAHRRLVLLVDDAERWIDAAATNALPLDLFTYLQWLLQTHPTLRMILALDTAREADLPALQPLAGEEYRLPRLTREEISDVIAEAHNDTAYRATGGFANLVQRAAQHLRGKTSESEIKAALAAVYTESSGEFRDIWLSLNQNERLVLTAISSLLYADPLGATTPEAISIWLVETDYPLDVTAIKAALRSLEYREILTHAAAPERGFVPAAGLLQTWLLENARLESSAASSQGGRRRALLLGIGLLLIAALLLSIALSTAPTPDATDAPIPTITLAPNP